MLPDLFDDDEMEMFEKWLEYDKNGDHRFWMKLKDDAPEKFKKIYEEVRNRYLNRR